MEQNNTTTKHMEKNNMTAVEWFFEVLAHNDIIDHKRLCDDENLYNLLYSLKNQAKQIEETQIRMAWTDGNMLGKNGLAVETYDDSKGYYSKNYGKD